MADFSTHLCQVMSLPQRDYVEGGGANGKASDQDEAQTPSLPASPGK